MYFKLNDVDLVKGAKNCIIVDYKKYKYYVIDRKFYKILKICDRGRKIETITNNTAFLIKILKNLEKLGIGSFYSKNNFDAKKSVIINDSLDMLWLNITNNCNYRCIHCYENANEEENNTSKLTIKDYDRIFKRIFKNFNKIKCVQITGGEPLLLGYDFIKELLDVIKKYNIELIEIFSNLYLLDEKFTNLFKKYKVHLATSCYSKFEKIHDSITQINGSYKTLHRNLEILKSNGIPFRIGIIIMNKNYKERETLYKWLSKKYSITFFKHYDLVRPSGRAADNKIIDEKLFKDKYFNEVCHFNKYNFDSYSFNKIYNSCWGNKLCIKSDGRLYPCVMSHVSVGKVRNIRKVLLSKNSYRFLNKDKIKVCKSCEYRYLCTECRAIYANSKKELRKKPFTCEYIPQKGEFNNENQT